MSWEKYDVIRSDVVHCLKGRGFKEPTTIQVEVLENYKHYYDFLLASQTGSGKTLAFGIPIVSELINYRQINPKHQELCCLILTPTRELALQIQEHLNQINPNNILKLVNVVGGLSKQKQLRLISYHPDILIATPGRLNELLQNQKQIITLKNLRFLVIDQADRMVELGHFKEVDNILDNIFNREIQTFDDVLQKQGKKIEKQEQTKFQIKNSKIKLDVNSLKLDELVEIPAELFKIYNQQPVKPIKSKEGKSKNAKSKNNKSKKEQTIKQVSLQKQAMKRKRNELNQPLKVIKKKIFLVSATLTKQFQDTKYYTKKKDKQRQQQQKQTLGNGSQGLAPKLKALISRINFTSKPKIIDLSGILLIPKQLQQYVSFCEDQNEKLAYLLCYLSDRLDKNKKVIIFTNTIKVSKKLAQMLTLLKFPNQVLHSFMQQRQRLNKLDNFSKGKSSPILISTDLAARGLDMIIDIVVQYGVPLNGDTYVHRLGRTARAGRQGENLIIVSKAQYGKWKNILKIAQGSSQPKHHNYLPISKQVQKHLQNIEIAERAYLNNRLVSKQQNQQWLKKQAQQIDIILDEDKDVNKDEGKVKTKKQIKKISIPTRATQLEQTVSKWRKNRFVMDPSDIQAYLAKKS